MVAPTRPIAIKWQYAPTRSLSHGSALAIDRYQIVARQYASTPWEGQELTLESPRFSFPVERSGLPNTPPLLASPPSAAYDQRAYPCDHTACPNDRSTPPSAPKNIRRQFSVLGAGAAVSLVILKGASKGSMGRACAGIAITRCLHGKGRMQSHAGIRKIRWIVFHQ